MIAQDDLTIVAAAPRGLSRDDLGRPYSANFQPLIGREGKSLFPESRKRKEAEASEFAYDSVQIENSHELRANASAWGIQAGFSNAKKRRYVSYRAIQITSVEEVDDTTEARAVSAKAAYYVRRIFYGRIYEIVLSGDEERFSLQAGADFLVFSGTADAFKKKHELQMSIFSRGLRPKASAIFARSPTEVADAYANDPTYNAGKAVPILVEYRRVPNAALSDFEPLPWRAGPPIKRQGPLDIRVLEVNSANDEWQTSGLTMEDGDVVAVAAEGQVDINGKGKRRAPDTLEVDQTTKKIFVGNGALEIKVGPAFSAYAGSSLVLAGQKGDVKFRVKDTGYKDNVGSFKVVVIRLPKGTIEDAVQALRAQ